MRQQCRNYSSCPRSKYGCYVCPVSQSAQARPHLAHYCSLRESRSALFTCGLAVSVRPRPLNGRGRSLLRTDGRLSESRYETFELRRSRNLDQELAVNHARGWLRDGPLAGRVTTRQFLSSFPSHQRYLRRVGVVVQRGILEPKEPRGPLPKWPNFRISQSEF